ncbi:Mannan polymerase complexes subunit MNN9 [Fulvia fulva]|uniref:Mannan polymerase complexes subunit MNN9 n=1 Tax=Passalora fulva TaxID=5499 RepID=A0A9Q8P469_PASFU|nr:Mannan polymerase complexes subunit MNN9 [Fulvia fulva]KAK4635478.1 Mannan polymerase complexes subunit MNN9 [Fulvia fulva]KAK4638295.1 Mannan polymerase complexes subunit MNN9 [Fulvia fulva]UJO12658.1 Mannan polymerase complexes subunit MNN9 [Fulvia fulva]WPV09964.1 Mannan polymerase complexes subunit MNN9 [Fulvia fulva]WPV24120.1 Mannan polymerase complexes subunit MNN9 [Fulvia fulva]
MAVSRGIRRTSPITYVFATILCIFFLYFFFGDSANIPSIAAAPRQLLKSKDAASNELSPPSLPFRKPAVLGPNEIAPPPPVVHYQMNNVTITADPVGNRESVLILTPLARFYQEYWDNLCKLSYPHDLISLGFIIPKGKEGNLATQQLQERMQKTQAPTNKNRFASITILRQDSEPPVEQTEKERHAMAAQKERRAAMSRARNSLLFTTLGPTTSWVLWLDSDIIETPPTLIQDLASHDKPIIVPNCFQRYYNKDKEAMDIRAYDFNSWQDSSTAQSLAAKMGPEEILLEGYAEIATYRSLMAYMAEEKGDPRKEIELDGVGGTALLVKADVHRDGAMFPPFPFYHLIETEGFAKMAQRLNWKAYGLPNYFVYHYK